MTRAAVGDDAVRPRQDPPPSTAGDSATLWTACSNAPGDPGAAALAEIEAAFDTLRGQTGEPAARAVEFVTTPEEAALFDDATRDLRDGGPATPLGIAARDVIYRQRDLILAERAYDRARSGRAADRGVVVDDDTEET